ncbi:MAG: DUF2974 domain-containing protein [Bacilli bacterium]|nr:DUF2974 domain-containing protein [Bacilli bacterium]
MDTIGYLKKYGNKKFSEVPFSVVDAMILAQISYAEWPISKKNVPFEKTTKAVKLRDYSSNKEIKELFSNAVSGPKIVKLYKVAIACKRYKHTRVAYIQDIFDDKKVVQFCAMTFLFKDANPVIAFRGTDKSLVGWKEDMQLAFKQEIQGQFESVTYIEKVIERVGSRFNIVGHSKGGNIAAYSLYKIQPRTYNLLDAVYNLDGPGFLYPEKIFEEENVKIRTEKMHKYIPIDSMVGILLNQTSEYSVVQSSKVLIGQHNPGNWKIDPKTMSVKLAKKRSQASKSVEASTYKWVTNNKPEDIEMCVNKIFEFLGLSDSTIDSLLKDIRGTIKRFMGFYNQESEEDKILLKRTMLGLLIEWRDVMLQYGKTTVSKINIIKRIKK